MNNESIMAPGCTGTRVQKLADFEGVQVLKVDVEPGGEIPLHTHECAATMVVIKGKARTLGECSRAVAQGDVVVKIPNEPHGFSEVREPFSFISISDNAGILRQDGWDITYK
jgi:quercetin dioxygenase-like cupin family protein